MSFNDGDNNNNNNNIKLDLNSAKYSVSESVSLTQELLRYVAKPKLKVIN